MYVFGIDIPLIEILFVYSFISLYVLIVVFLEMRRLKRIIILERVDIKELEDELRRQKGTKKG